MNAPVVKRPVWFRVVAVLALLFTRRAIARGWLACGARMSGLKALSGGLSLLLATACAYQQRDIAVDRPAAPSTGWQFEATPAWQDEFDYTGLPEPARWNFDQGGDGWGNHELQHYTDSIRNAQV